MKLKQLEKQWEKEIRRILGGIRESSLKENPIDESLHTPLNEVIEVLVRNYVDKARKSYLESEKELELIRKKITKNNRIK